MRSSVLIRFVLTLVSYQTERKRSGMTEQYLQTNQKLASLRENKRQVFDSVWMERLSHKVHAVYDGFL